MTIKFKNNIDLAAIKTRIQEENKKRLSVALEDAVSEIKDRTTSGKDVQGASFKALTPSYKRYKLKKTGRDSADMLLSGQMLAAIRTKVEESARGVLIGRIYFISVAEALKARGNQKLRKFFGISKEQLARIANKLKGN